MDWHGTRQYSTMATIPEEGMLAPGTVLQQRYHILDVKGSGGMAVVYRARDLRFEKATRVCAVKEMLNSAPDPRLRELTVQSFDREANVLASLSHPAVPSIFDYFTEGNRIYLVMEFVEGQDLEEIIEESPGPLAQEKVTDWAIQVCEVLTYLHNHKPDPFVFRDLKPSNMMLNQHDRIVLVDFGIAKVFESGQRGTMIGTEGYTPPEQYRGVAEPRGDIYALGATMHHLLTKRDPRLEPPFSFHERPIRELNPEVSESLEATVMKSLEYEVDKRFSTAAEFGEALRTLNKPALGNAGAPATVAFPTSAISFAQTGNVLPVWEFECEDEVRSSPTVSEGVVYVGCYDHNLYAVNARDGEFLWKYPTKSGVSSSPCVWNGLVVVGSEDSLMYGIHKQTGKLAWTAKTGDRVRSSPAVAMEHVFFGSDDHALYNLSVRNGRESWKFQAESHVRSSPAVSSNLVYFGADDGYVYALDIQTSKLKWRFLTQRPVISRPLYYEGLVFFGSMDWNVYAVDAERGWAVWNYRTRNWVVSSPAVSESLGLVYVGSGDRCVYAFDYSNGSSWVWKYEAEGPIGSSPVVSEDAVYIGSADGHVYSLDAQTGDLRWKFYSGAGVVSTPTLWENMVFVGSRNHKLYALIQ